MLALSWFAALPLVTFAVAWFTPEIVFPKPPPVKAGSVALLLHCKKLGHRYFTASVVVTVVVFVAALHWFVLPADLVLGTASDRIVYTLQLEVVSLMFYVLCIFRVAFNRSDDPNAVSGERVGVSTAVEMASRVLQNTSEQLLLGTFSHLALSTVLRPDQCAVLPAAVSLWLSGRILFLLGYTATNPLAREFGFELTIMPSLASLTWVTFHLIAKLLGQ